MTITASNKLIQIPNRRTLAGLIVAACGGLAGCSSVRHGSGEIAPTTPARHTVATVAVDQVDDGYADNMAGPKQYDNTGLTYYAYRQNGKALPRSLNAQLNAGKPIALDQAQPGDLVFFQVDTAGGGHRLMVGLLTDTENMIIALPGNTDQGGGVRQVSLKDRYWQQRLVGVERILAPAASTSRAD